ncbi:unnamed protein product [Sphenostylis stenocarpa]|uniref:Uncharacterized protein n=1 Tax=Sphenostylis stenocarpa TaxID=92480 RepID=A0AA86S8E8_9FABA|nr:unnamed protein product [Sphenostylis stenocarpa]
MATHKSGRVRSHVVHTFSEFYCKMIGRKYNQAYVIRQTAIKTIVEMDSENLARVVYIHKLLKEKKTSHPPNYVVLQT